ncbi:MAG: phosphatase PAP2 family protein [Burkholderiales bacterium]
MLRSKACNRCSTTTADGSSYPHPTKPPSAGTLVASTRTLWIERSYILCAAALMTVLVGASGIALDVHWATDVLGGWAFGSGWAIAWLLLASFLDRRPDRR